MPFSKTILNRFAFLIFLFISTSAAAQDPTDTVSTPKSYFKFSLGYLSNAVYNGRRDSAVLPYLRPSISWHDKGGLYIEASLSYLAGTDAGIDAGEIAAGYEFESKNGKLSGDLNASKYFTNQSSYSVHGEINGAIGSSLYYNTGPVSVTGGANISFSGNTDIGVDFGLSHPFQFGDNKSWSITPSALVNAGTQNFDKNYFTNRKFSKQRKRRSTSDPAAVKVIVVTKSFAVLDYELSLPLDYAGHKWGLFLTPTFSIPMNGFKYSLDNGVTYRSENLVTSFYAEVGAYVKF